jgi:hypothetical protein
VEVGPERILGPPAPAGPRGGAGAARPLLQSLQPLPSAPGDLWNGACGPLLRGGAGGEAGDRDDDLEERAAACPGRASATRGLPGGPGGRASGLPDRGAGAAGDPHAGGSGGGAATGGPGGRLGSAVRGLCGTK